MNAQVKLDRMMEATRLTREGRLDEAMAVIRTALGGAPAQSASALEKPPLAAATDTIDLVPPSPQTGAAWTLPDTASSADQASKSSRPGREGILKGLGALHRSPLRNGSAGFAGTRTPTATLPDGARFETRAFANAAGSRDYKLYVPSGYAGQALPLVVMLHGCTQSPDDFAVGTRMNELAEAQLCLVAYPAQARAANAQKCWNWFQPADQTRDSGEPSLIAGITREIMRDFRVDETRIYVAGLSAGGAAAAVMGQRYPDLYAAVGVHSGLACGAASDMPSAFAAMRQGGTPPAQRGQARVMPTIVFHGDRDATVTPINGAQVITQARGAARLHASVSEGTTPSGMRYVKTTETDTDGRAQLEHWALRGGGHAWSGGSAAGSYTDPRGVDASAEMLRFFFGHRRTA